MSYLYKYTSIAFITSVMTYSIYAEYNSPCNNTSVIFNNCITLHQLNEYINAKNKSKIKQLYHDIYHVKYTKLEKIKE